MHGATKTPPFLPLLLRIVKADLMPGSAVHKPGASAQHLVRRTASNCIIEDSAMRPSNTTAGTRTRAGRAAAAAAPCAGSRCRCAAAATRPARRRDPSAPGAHIMQHHHCALYMFRLSCLHVSLVMPTCQAARAAYPVVFRLAGSSDIRDAQGAPVGRQSAVAPGLHRTHLHEVARRLCEQLPAAQAAQERRLHSEWGVPRQHPQSGGHRRWHWTAAERRESCLHRHRFRHV